MDEQEENTVPLKKDALDSKQVRLWLSRCQTSNRIHRSRLIPRYNTAKARYNGELTAELTKQNRMKHQDVNFLFKDVEDFNSSIYFKNPEIDLISRNTQDEEAVRNIENLQQLVNDDIKDDDSLKSTIRAGLVDENLAGLTGFYLEYDYRSNDKLGDDGSPVSVMDGENPMMDESGQPLNEQEEISQKVKLCKLRPENLIYPPFQTLYNYTESPYLGYVDIVPLEVIKADPTYDKTIVEKLKGKEYDELSDIDLDEIKKDSEKLSDELMFVKIYVVFIKGHDNAPLKRLVLADEQGLSEALAYDDYDKGHGKDDRGYPIYILALNDSASGFIPPSEAWNLEPILQLLDYLWQKQVTHLKTSKTRTFARVGKEGLKKTDIFKWVSNNDMEIFGVNHLAPGVDIRSLIMQMTDQPLSDDHVAMYELAKRIFDQLSRQPSFSQAAILQKKKTATESVAIQSEDKSLNAYKIDKFKDFLKAVFYDWAKLRQRNLQGYKTITVENRQSGQSDIRQVGSQEIQGDFNAKDIQVDSFVAPNKELKRRIIKETLADSALLMPILKEQGLTLNGKRISSEYFQNAEVRNPDELVVKVPQRAMDQQVNDFVFKQVPFNANELGGDLQKELTRLMQIFGDEQLMASMEQFVPGISGPQSPLAEFARGLEMLVKQTGNGQKPGPTMPMQAQNDMGAEAGMMAGAMAQ